jgi:hypothetical protein
MENLVVSLYGFWFWLTRKYRAAQYTEVADVLSAARTYLHTDYVSRASTLDRGFLLPAQVEALSILESHHTFVTHTSRRLHTFSECRKFVAEELAQLEKAA